jgi:hypothetical protein
MSELKLKPINAYTVYSSDDEMRSSNKGVYKDYNIASTKAIGSGWYGSNGEVKSLNDVYEDESGELYTVKHVGKFTDVAEKFREDTLASIKSKLTKAELELLGVS